MIKSTLRSSKGTYTMNDATEVCSRRGELRNARVTSEEHMSVELKIIQKSLECIKSTTGRSVPKQSKWLITEYDLHYCGTIGGGGFSTVSKAQFRGTLVAVKTLKDIGNTREALEREMEIWSTLRHDHIVPFYGASTLTSPPYIVSRYMQNGNLVRYLVTTPAADRTKLILEVSLGMYYLHEESVVHGDLKGVNVLVDDSGKACITDFGLSRVCSSKSEGTEKSKIAGTLRYLAPEALKGQPLSFETDVYAFGMLIYEVFTGEVPFIREPDSSVAEGRVELHRPTSSKVYEHGFNDTLWRLLSDCISREPLARPRFKTIQEHLYSIKKAEPSDLSVHAGPMLDSEDNRLTDWGLDTKFDTKPMTIMTSISPTVLDSSAPRDFRTSPSSLPVCIQATRKYFGVQFSASREPGVYLEEAGTFPWQPIRAKKGTLLYQDGNKFWYRSSVGQENNSWELCGNYVTLRTASINPGVCHFRDAKIAQRWYGLQLSYARDGTVYDLGTVIGDWFCTERSWRRLALGRIQQADLADGDPNTLPTDRSWSDVKLPKRCVIYNDGGTENCIVCIINPGKQSGKLCCKREGRRIVFESFRQQNDQEPINAREEIYPSEEYAEAAFSFLNTALGKVAGKGIKLFTRSR
ncbi:kinase-like domain-containing protein [Boletus edulis]|nr:kinase-like domain-containing protein [Boletus edulis]